MYLLLGMDLRDTHDSQWGNYNLEGLIIAADLG